MILEDGGISDFHRRVLDIVNKIYGGDVINTNYHIKINNKNLYFDIYLPRLKLAIEVDGRQHYEFVEHFHRDSAGFIESKRNDAIKEEFCRENRITLVRVLYNEVLSEDLIKDKVIKALKDM